MKKLLFILLLPCFCIGQNISIGKQSGMKKTTGTASSKLGGNHRPMVYGSGLNNTGIIVDTIITLTDTIKVKALITTDKIKAPFEVELLLVRGKGEFSMLAIYPAPVRLNKYLTLDKKELPATTTVWIAK